MRLYEFEAKKVLAEAGIPVPRCFGVIQSADELEKNSLPYPVVLKAQVLVGGRGKAGGVKIAVNATEAKTEAEEIL
ncbi:MAG: succinate--CoA ligase subunit beta, partial [bacterium]|nr:succinate--CoA ligase subunit beta [bacterium]